MKMVQIKFSHWFWITLASGVLHCELTNSISTEENTEELALVRRGQSYDSRRTSEKGDGFYLQRLTPSEQEEELTTRKSVSVSHVRVEVGDNERQQTRKLMKKKIRKVAKPRRTFLEKIYAKIKEFARVTLNTRKVTNDGNKVSHSEANSFGRDNSETHSHDLIDGNQLPAASDTEQRRHSDPDTSTEQGMEEKLMEERSNVMSFSEFSDGPMPASVDTSDRPQLDNDAGLDDIETSNKARIIENSSNEVTRSGKSEEAPRSEGARARSLWLVSRPRQAKVDLSRNDNQVSGGASFSSFSQERAVLFDRETVGETGQARGEGVGVLLEWSNLIILGISVATALAFITVLVVAILYRRAKFRDSSQRECDQFSDIVSTSSRSSGSTTSTISSTRSTRSQVPDKMDIISFNAEGNLRKSAYNCDDLYSLDSDYFLSSLEDISVQI